MSKLHGSLSLLAVLLVGLIALAVWQRHVPLVGTGWVAKRLCSAVFVSGRTPEDAVEVAIPLPIPLPIPGVVDRENQSVTAYFANLFAPSTARFRDSARRSSCAQIPPSEGTQRL